MAGKKLVASILSSITLTVSAQVIGIGEYAIGPDNTVKNACHMAELRAISDAAFKVYGKTVTTNQTKACDTCNIDTSISINTKAIVDKVLNRQFDVRKDVCFATVEVLLKPESFLNISVKGKDIHRVGTVVDYDINTVNSVYMYVFATHSEKLAVIYPRDYNNRMVRGSFKLSSELGLNLVPILYEGQTSAKNEMYFLFSTVPLDFDRNSMTLFQLNEMVDALPSYSKRFFKRSTLIVN